MNLGIENAPKKVYVGKKMKPKIKAMLIALLRKYKHVFAWSYDDLKAYRGIIPTWDSSKRKRQAFQAEVETD